MALDIVCESFYSSTNGCTNGSENRIIREGGIEIAVEGGGLGQSQAGE